MRDYLHLLDKIIHHGQKKGTRGYETIGLFDLQFSFDLSTGNFPLITSRQVGFKSMAAELWCFIQGITSKKAFRDAGTTIWDEWANPVKIPANLKGDELLAAQIAEDDLGPIYGYQWRNFNGPYTFPVHAGFPPSESITDQLATVCERLRTNPNDRRMVVCAWNPMQMHQMALPPCHVLFNLVVYDGMLNLKWHQRSCDMVLGVPFNIASYALLTILLAKHANLKPGVVSGTFCDAHIYAGDTINHIPGVLEQLHRPCFPLPQVEFLSTGNQFDIFLWKPSDCRLVNYQHGPKIPFDVAV